ncbi:hypothetical protein Mapa_013989 [Marchantia paleacea]|nr:hypothetical protein Mapa_013989 [Marchantia paleacea]
MAVETSAHYMMVLPLGYILSESESLKNINRARHSPASFRNLERDRVWRPGLVRAFHRGTDPLQTQSNCSHGENSIPGSFLSNCTTLDSGSLLQHHPNDMQNGVRVRKLQRLPVTLKYGKYCGVGYTGCSGQTPCDGLDACCQTHDNCVGSNNLKNYVDTGCSNALLDCVETWDASNSAQFAGNTCLREDVVNTIAGVMKLITIDGHLGNAATTATAILSPISMLGAVLLIHFFVYQ